MNTTDMNQKVIRMSKMLGVILLTYGSLLAQDLPGGEVVTKGMMSNNVSVPEVFTMSSSFQRIVIVRLKYQKDILEGIEEAVEREGIKNGVILSGVGSVIRYHLHAVDNAVFPSELVFWEKNDPMDITSMNGYIIDGRVHAHMTLANDETAIGGHIEPRTKVFTFCIITIAEVSDETSLHRMDDKTWR